MNLRQLEVFRAVCEQGGFTRAAQSLYMTQPAVSHVIAELEKEAVSYTHLTLPTILLV